MSFNYLALSIQTSLIHTKSRLNTVLLQLLMIRSYLKAEFNVYCDANRMTPAMLSIYKIKEKTMFAGYLGFRDF